MQEKLKKKTQELKKVLDINRINILLLLYEKDTCVCQMVKELNIKHNLISHHLKTLQDIKYISSTRNGTHIMYNLNENKRKTVEILFNILKS